MTQKKQHSALVKVIQSMAMAVRFVAVCLVLADIFLMSGLLERRIIPGVSQRIFGARINLWLEGRNPLYVRGLTIQGDNDTPLLYADAVSLRYRFSPFPTPPRIKSVDALGLRLHVDGRNPDNPNYAFLLSHLEAGDSNTDASYWFPETFSASEISIRADMPDWSAAVTGLRVEARMEAMNDITASIHGRETRAAWQSGFAWPDVPETAGNVSATFGRTPESVTLATTIDLPDFLVLDGEGVFIMEPTPQVRLNMDSLELNGPLFGMLLSLYAPLDITFEAATIAPLHLNASLRDKFPLIEDAEIDAHVKNLALNYDGRPWYSGDLRIHATGSHETYAEAQWATTFGQGQRISGTFAADEAGIGLDATLADWTAAHIISLWPEPLVSYKPYLPEFQHVGATLSCRFQDDTITLDTTLSPLLSSGTTAAIAASGTYTLQEHEASIQGRMTLGDGHCTFQAAMGPATPLTATLSVEQMNASEALLLTPLPTLKDLDALVSATMDIQREENGAYHFSLTARTPTPAYGAWKLPETFDAPELSANGVLDADFSSIIADGALRLTEGVDVNLHAFHYNIRDSHIAARFNGSAELATLGPVFDQHDLWGDMTVAGAFSMHNWRNGEISPLHLSFDPLGYDHISLPYGQPLTLDLPIRFDLETLSVDAGPVHAALDEGTHFSADTIQVTPEGIMISSSLLFESDFSPLVAKQYLAAADGRIMVKVEDFAYDDTGLGGIATYNVNASQITLPENLANMQGVTLAGTASLRPHPSGKGTLRIDESLVGGITLRQTTGSFTLNEDRIVIENTNLSLLGGGVTGGIELRPFEAGIPIIVSGEANDIDLRLFTNEFDPPSLVLTGLVNGTFEAGFTSQQLTMLNVDLAAHENFSMNRDMVEQLLLQQYVGEMTGSRQMARMLESVIGKDAQRSFDSARLKLGLEDERIAGYAKLESAALDLTIDIMADPQAVLEALRARRQ